MAALLQVAVARRCNSGWVPRIRRFASSAVACSTHANTLRWVDEWVIGLNLCPYTKGVRNRASALGVTVSSASTDESFADEISAEVTALVTGGGPETSLIVVPPTSPWGKALHEDYGSFLLLGWQVDELLTELVPDQSVMQVLFHPLALRDLYVQTDDDDDPGEFAMRSPHPTVHLLRASDVQALPPNHAAQVPTRNKATLAQLGISKLRELHVKLR